MGRGNHRHPGLTTRALLAAALLTGVVPVTAAAADGPAPRAAATAADDPVPEHESMPDDGTADEPEGEQDDSAVAPGLSRQAAPPLAAPVPGRTQDFRLAAGSGLGGLVDQLDAALPKQGVTGLMEQANRTAGWDSACPDTSIYGADLLVSRRVCWMTDDAGSTEWVPQAITGVSDAQEDEDWGDSPSDPVLVGSYDNANPGRSDYAAGRDNCLSSSVSDACNEKGVRITFINQATHKYRHVLLVWPYINNYDHISFDALHAAEGTCNQVVTTDCAAQNGIHAGGMVWYGNYLYVADTANGFRVFDMRRIMDLNPDEDATVHDPTPDGLVSNVENKRLIGRQSNVWYSYGYRYVMPQVATLKFTTALPTESRDGNKCFATARPKASYVSLDRTDTDHLLVGEYCNTNSGGDSNGRVATYPMADVAAAVESAAGTTVDADLAFGLPTEGQDEFGGEDTWHKIQGALRYEGKWYFHRSNGYDNGRLLQAAPQSVDGSTRLVGNPTLLESSYGPEDLYLAHGRGDGKAPELWSLSEHAPSDDCGACAREVYSYDMGEVTADFAG
ncbi:hypothetical protein [Streptomyces sp. CRN 30]|uniref:hypothetical protein n=1 Tax=Streptomyces sp. CRN 30 TaxID=3075613 RepID=UPI002A7F277D|nr:hypothetical protein [Streptomyces sp. CRN 30]